MDDPNFRILPKTDHYPGLVGQPLPNNREIVVFGDPAAGQQLLLDRLEQIEAVQDYVLG